MTREEIARRLLNALLGPSCITWDDAGDGERGEALVQADWIIASRAAALRAAEAERDAERAKVKRLREALDPGTCPCCDEPCGRGHLEGCTYSTDCPAQSEHFEQCAAALEETK